MYCQAVRPERDPPATALLWATGVDPAGDLGDLRRGEVGRTVGAKIAACVRLAFCAPPGISAGTVGWI